MTNEAHTLSDVEGHNTLLIRFCGISGLTRKPKSVLQCFISLSFFWLFAPLDRQLVRISMNVGKLQVFGPKLYY